MLEHHPITISLFRLHSFHLRNDRCEGQPRLDDPDSPVASVDCSLVRRAVLTISGVRGLGRLRTGVMIGKRRRPDDWHAMGREAIRVDEGSDHAVEPNLFVKDVSGAVVGQSYKAWGGSVRDGVAVDVDPTGADVSALAILVPSPMGVPGVQKLVHSMS